MTYPTNRRTVINDVSGSHWFIYQIQPYPKIVCIHPYTLWHTKRVKAAMRRRLSLDLHRHVRRGHVRCRKFHSGAPCSSPRHVHRGSQSKQCNSPWQISAAAPKRALPTWRWVRRCGEILFPILRPAKASMCRFWVFLVFRDSPKRKVNRDGNRRELWVASLSQNTTCLDAS